MNLNYDSLSDNISFLYAPSIFRVEILLDNDNDNLNHLKAYNIANNDDLIEFKKCILNN